MYPRYETNFEVLDIQRRLRKAAINPVIKARVSEVQELRRQGLSYPVIAEMLGVSVGTAWNAAQANGASGQVGDG